MSLRDEIRGLGIGSPDIKDLQSSGHTHISRFTVGRVAKPEELGDVSARQHGE